jgi:outer membrane protein TolC
VRRQLEIADNRYRAGLATYLEVAAAQNAALGIERTGVRLRGLQRVSVAALIKSLGGGRHCFSSMRNEFSESLY